MYQIYHNLNCKGKYVIYLLECTKFKIQYVEKAETEFNIRLNNHRKDVWSPDAIPPSCHFSGKNHNFNTQVKFILIEQIRHIDIDNEKNKERLKQRENFWILTLETLTPILRASFCYLIFIVQCIPIFLNYYVITNRHITN